MFVLYWIKLKQENKEMPLHTHPLRAQQFLKKLDLVKNKKSFVRITMLTADELPI